MKTAKVVLTSVLTMIGLSGRPVSAETTVVVNLGPHASATDAGYGEEDVDWLDVDRTDDTTCTQCFAALELQRYLRKMTGRSHDFAITDDRQLPNGDAILVGGPESNAVSRELAEDLGGTRRESSGL